MTSDLFPGVETQTLRCFAGHDWTRPKSHGSPKACPVHHKFLVDIIGPRYSPPKRVIAIWKETAVLDEPDAYVKRWRRTWERTVRQVAARHDSFQLVDLEVIEEYIRHKRLAEVHRAYAEYEPYQNTTQGTIKPHPGWYQAQVEEKFARHAAITLGLVSEAGDSGQAGGDRDEGPDDGYTVYDDQLGPDGQPL